MGPSIFLKNVGLKYGDNTILHDINHEFAPGECHVVMGPNGGGKTSLLRSILGLTPFRGDIQIHWPERQGKVGYVPQKAMFESSLPLTVMDFILLNQSRTPLFWPKWRSRTKEKANALVQLERVGMAARADRRMGQLSGGEQQRVAIARALVNDPELLLADEPTGNLDTHTSEEVFNLMIELNRQRGMSMILVTHNRELTRKVGFSHRLQDGIILD